MSIFQTQYEALLKQYDPVGDGDLTVDEWIKLCTEEVFKKCIAWTILDFTRKWPFVLLCNCIRYLNTNDFVNKGSVALACVSAAKYFGAELETFRK